MADIVRSSKRSTNGEDNFIREELRVLNLFNLAIENIFMEQAEYHRRMRNTVATVIAFYIGNTDSRPNHMER